ncbi:hypothetical protein IIA15_10860 [candidate division TA06 bacterium]|nr:hypothetical protein [candidate division TA06 bacterium]
MKKFLLTFCCFVFLASLGFSARSGGSGGSTGGSPGLPTPAPDYADIR